MIGLPHIRLAMGFFATLSLRSGLRLRMTEVWLSACNTKVIARTPIYRGTWQSKWCSVMRRGDCRAALAMTSERNPSNEENVSPIYISDIIRNCLVGQGLISLFNTKGF